MSNIGGYQTEEKAIAAIRPVDTNYAYVVEGVEGRYHVELTAGAAADRLLVGRNRVSLRDQKRATDLAFDNADRFPPVLRQSDL